MELIKSAPGDFDEKDIWWGESSFNSKGNSEDNQKQMNKIWKTLQTYISPGSYSDFRLKRELQNKDSLLSKKFPYRRSQFLKIVNRCCDMKEKQLLVHGYTKETMEQLFNTILPDDLKDIIIRYMDYADYQSLDLEDITDQFSYYHGIKNEFHSKIKINKNHHFPEFFSSSPNEFITLSFL